MVSRARERGYAQICDSICFTFFKQLLVCAVVHLMSFPRRRGTYCEFILQLRSNELRKTKQMQTGEQNTNNQIRHNYGGRSRSRWLYGANNMEYNGDFKNHGAYCVWYFTFVYFRKNSQDILQV